MRIFLFALRVFGLLLTVLIFAVLAFLFLKLSAEFKFCEKRLKLKLKSGLLRFEIKEKGKKAKKQEKSAEKKAEEYLKNAEPKKVLKTYKKYVPAVCGAFEYLSGRLEIKNVCMYLEYGTGDAAHTGILYGIIQIITGNLFAAAVRYLNCDYPQISINPDFNQSCFDLKASGIIKARPVHIIIAYLKFCKQLKEHNKNIKEK